MLEYPKEGENMWRTKLRKSDYILFCVTVIFATVLLIVQRMTPDSHGQLIVLIDGEETASYSLNESDDEFTINNGTNTIQISEGRVRMIGSNCPDQICVHHKEISKNNETIVCLPNKIVLVIENASEATIDASTN